MKDAMHRPLIGIGLTLMALLFASPAFAGDRASSSFIGYSESGQYFAFEEYGFQDGSGFAFSTIYILDLDKDAWVKGSPFRLQADDENTALDVIRARARTAADTGLKSAAINYPVEIAALIGDGVPDTDATTLRFGVPGFRGPGTVEGDFTLDLEQFPIGPETDPCVEFIAERPLGYALSITAEGKTHELHRDTSLPASRGCPVAYRLFAVVTPIWQSSLTHAVAIISVFSHGFEGPDRNFIAVPLVAP
jgi:predicted secreted protein